MSLKDDMDDDLDIFFNEDEFAENAKYTSIETGTVVDVRILIDYGFSPGEDISQTKSTQAKVHLIKSELPAPAQYGDLLEIDGEQWQVVKQSVSDSLVVSLDLRKDARLMAKK